MIWAKLVFGGFGRRGLEAVIAFGVLVLAAAIVTGSLMVVEGAREAIARAAEADRYRSRAGSTGRSSRRPEAAICRR